MSLAAWLPARVFGRGEFRLLTLLSVGHIRCGLGARVLDGRSSNRRHPGIRDIAGAAQIVAVPVPVAD